MGRVGFCVDRIEAVEQQRSYSLRSAHQRAVNSPAIVDGQGAGGAGEVNHFVQVQGFYVGIPEVAAPLTLLPVKVVKWTLVASGNDCHRTVFESGILQKKPDGQ